MDYALPSIIDIVPISDYEIFQERKIPNRGSVVALGILSATIFSITAIANIVVRPKDT